MQIVVIDRDDQQIMTEHIHVFAGHTPSTMSVLTPSALPWL